MLYKTKKLMLNQIAEARSSHTRWMRRAKHLIEGLPVTDGMVCLDPTHCHFGTWFYKEAVKYKHVLKLEKIIQKIEKHHLHLHDIYLEIYKIYFVDAKRSWVVAKLLASSYKEPGAKQQEMAKMYLKELEDVSRELMRELSAVERIIATIDEKEFYAYV